MDPELDYIIKFLLRNRKYEDVRRLSIDKIEFHEGILSSYLRSFDHLKVQPDIKAQIYDEVRSLFNKGVRFQVLLESKIDLEMEMHNCRKAINSIEAYKEQFGIDDYYAYSMVVAKLNNHDYTDLEEEKEYLLSSDKPLFHFLVASLKAEQEMWEEAKAIALNILYLQSGNLQKETLNSFISLFFYQCRKRGARSAV